MIKKLFAIMLYGLTFLSLFLVDYLLGNGFIDMFWKLFCKVVCFVRKSIRDEDKQIETIRSEDTVNLPVLVIEIAFLCLTIAFLNKFKQMHSKDNIDALLLESKEALQQTNEFLEKWRLRKINWQAPNHFTYLDEEPQEITPLKLEVPILHMAIIDTLGTNRNKLERGDAGDTINITDSTLLSMTSLLDLDDDFNSLSDTTPEIDDKSFEGRGHPLWDVIDEDATFQN